MPQSLAKILVHIIFSTKNRKPFIRDDIIKDLHAYLAGICQTYKVFVHEIGGIEDHVHLLISLPRTLTLCDLVEEIKKGSSKWIKTKGNFYQNFAWQSGYCGVSIGHSNYNVLIKYIQNQRKHHKKFSFQDEYRAFLKKYEIEYNENYVWD
jgi:REP element-mobilizing transposase RayT